MAAQLSEIFPGMGQTASDPFAPYKTAQEAANAPWVSGIRGALGILGNRVAEEKQYAALLGQSQAQAQAERSKSLMDAILSSREIEARWAGPTLGRMSAMEREQRIKDYTSWAPRTKEDWLWALQQRQKFGAKRGGADGEDKKDLDDYSLPELLIMRKRYPEPSSQFGLGFWGGGQQTAPDLWKPYRDRIDATIQRKTMLIPPEEEEGEGGGIGFPTPK